MKNELISIIVPIYNVEQYLEECINSIINQTYKNLEIILVDDGSTDNSSKKCDEWKKKDKRIKVIHKQNGGLSDARNVGIINSSGSYLTFIDSDDTVNIHMIEVQYKNLIEYNADISICDYVIYTDGKRTINYREEVSNNKIVTSEGIDIFNNLFNEKMPITTLSHNKLFKKEIFEKVRFPKGRVHEDVFTIHHILGEAKKIVYSEAKTYYYRCCRKGSITSTFSVKELDGLEGLKDRMNYFNDNYKNTKYANLSIESYYDKLIRLYCNFTYHNQKKDYNNTIRSLKKEYNGNYKKVIKATKKIRKKFKYFIFRCFPNLFYKITKRKYFK